MWVVMREEANNVSAGCSALQGSVWIRPISEKQDKAENLFLSLVSSHSRGVICFWDIILLKVA